MNSRPVARARLTPVTTYGTTHAYVLSSIRELYLVVLLPYAFTSPIFHMASSFLKMPAWLIEFTTKEIIRSCLLLRVLLSSIIFMDDVPTPVPAVDRLDLELETVLAFL